MILSRRAFLSASGGGFAALACPALVRAAPGAVEIVMSGRDYGAVVWFDPIGVLVEPGATIRWINRDAGNAHTSTAYHPDIEARQRRIPRGATPWNSDYLLPDEDFSVVLAEPGVYDYYCVPHEMAGMVGRIVVGTGSAELDVSETGEPPPDVALAAFPDVARIVADGVVRVG